MGQLDRVAVEGQRPAQRFTHRMIVVDDKNPHGH
jgi:hypothetical protein